jgi:hypothetical protein
VEVGEFKGVDVPQDVHVNGVLRLRTPIRTVHNMKIININNYSPKIKINFESQGINKDEKRRNYSLKIVYLQGCLI